MENLAALGDPAENIVQYTLDRRERPRALQQLRLMNVSRASLFPGLEGYAQSFQHALVQESPEQKEQRLVKRILQKG